MIPVQNNLNPNNYQCWGRQYADADAECQGCDSKASCRASVLGHQQPAYSTPPRMGHIRPPPPSPGWKSPSSYPPPYPPRGATSGPGINTAPLQNGQNINGQFEGETVGERLVKNMILRTAEACTGEVWKFLNQFPWPP